MIYAELNKDNIVVRVFESDTNLHQHCFVRVSGIPPAIGTQWNGAEFVPYAQEDKAVVTKEQYISEYIGFDVLAAITNVTRGLAPYQGAYTPSPELSARVDAAWKYAENLALLDLKSARSQQFHELLVQSGCITQAQSDALTSGNSLLV